MKSIITTSCIAVLLFAGVGCKKDDPLSNDYNTPSTAAPEGLQGNWSSGFVSMTQLVDVYTGEYVGNAWKSGKFFKITADGKHAEFYYAGQSQYLQSATKAIGTIAFDDGSDATEGSFVFYAGWAHYNGWGTTPVNRDATKQELSNNLTAKYYYRKEGNWLRIEPKAPVNDYSSSFELIN
ncbi:MAG: hypothetical protein QM802_00700 [Agriterribacter sp.]